MSQQIVSGLQVLCVKPWLVVVKTVEGSIVKVEYPQVRFIRGINAPEISIQRTTNEGRLENTSH